MPAKGEHTTYRTMRGALPAYHPCSRASIGECYLLGLGVAKDIRLGMPYMTEGAMDGSQFGCYWLADSFAKGIDGMPKDAKQATKWYRKMSECEVQSAGATNKEEAAAWLRDHAVD